MFNSSSLIIVLIFAGVFIYCGYVLLVSFRRIRETRTQEKNQITQLSPVDYKKSEKIGVIYVCVLAILILLYFLFGRNLKLTTLNKFKGVFITAVILAAIFAGKKIGEWQKRSPAENLRYKRINIFLTIILLIIMIFFLGFVCLLLFNYLKK